VFSASIITTLFSYSKEDLDTSTEKLSSVMGKTLLTLKPAWALQDEAFISNMPYNENKINTYHTFDRNSMGTVFPFFNSMVGHNTGIPLGFNLQTGLPIIYDNFSKDLTNYNMVVFGKSPTSKTIINIFDLETEIVLDEITQKEKRVLNVESKVEDVTQAILTMAKGSTKSKEVNEITKQIISEVVSEEYRELGINSNPSSLYEDTSDKSISNNFLGSKKKKMPTLGSWYRRLEKTAEESTNDDYRFHFSYLLKVMKQYIRDFGGQLAYFDGQSTFDLGDHVPFINLDISQLEERFARPLAQQILLSWVWEKYVKKNSEDKKKANKKRVIVDEAWMLLPFPEAVDFLNTMARRARKRNVSLALVSQRFQDFYEMSAVQAVLTSSDTKLFLAQDNAEIDYIRETFKLSEGEASFLATATVGKGLLKIGDDTTILSIEPTQMEFEFVDTNINTKVERENAKAKKEEN